MSTAEELPPKEENLPAILNKLQEDEVFENNCFSCYNLLCNFWLSHSSILQVIVNTQLDHILMRHCHVEAKLQSIGKVLPNVAVIRSEGEKFRNMIDRTNKLAEKVSAKVRQLDLARVSTGNLFC